MPSLDKLGVLALLIAISLLASVVLTWPARDGSLCGFSFTLSGRTLLLLVVLCLACSGADSIVRAHPTMQARPSLLLWRHWVLPAAVAAVSWAWVSLLSSLPSQVVAIVAGSLSLSAVTAMEYYSIDERARWQTAAQWALRFLTYVLATLLYVGLQLSVPDSRLGAASVAVLSAILSLRLLSGEGWPLRRLCPYALGAGALVGVGSYLLDRGAASPQRQSLLLVVLLYVLTEALRSFLARQLTRRSLCEYLAVALLVLLLLASHFR